MVWKKALNDSNECVMRFYSKYDVSNYRKVKTIIDEWAVKKEAHLKYLTTRT